MSRCCCTTSPRAAAAIIASWAPRWRCELCPRFGLDEAETETVAWLVRYHLLLSATPPSAATSPIPRRSRISSRTVQSPERLRLLLILTVVDIRAVGPTTWNDWKRQLLRTLFDAAEERLRLGHKQRGRHEQVEARQRQLAEALPWKASAIRAHARRLPDSYWLAEPPEWQHGQCAAGGGGRGPFRRCRAVGRRPQPDALSGMTRVSVFAPDRPGLFYRIAAALERRGRVDRRCAHPHHPRRHGARQSAGHRCARQSL